MQRQMDTSDGHKVLIDILSFVSMPASLISAHLLLTSCRMNSKKATRAEDDRIMEMVKEHGTYNWELLAAKLGEISSLIVNSSSVCI